MCAIRKLFSASTCVSSRVALAIVLLTSAAAAQQPGTSTDAVRRRAMEDFQAGRVTESLVGFDRVAAMDPREVPRLWQRALAYYYLDRFKDCRTQLEVHLKVNPDDVEVPAWHYLCVARMEGPEKARAALLPVGTDPRVPMREVYLLYAGKLSVESVLVAGNVSPSGRFYAALYVGLYYEAQGNSERARFYISQAAGNEFAGVGGYMNSTAKVHMQVRKWTPPTTKATKE